MLAAVLVTSLLASVYCVPTSPPIIEPIHPAKEVTPDLAKSTEHGKVHEAELPLEIPLQDGPVVVGGESVVPGGAPGPVDVVGSPDANPGVNAHPGGQSDLDTDATFWGYGGWGGGYRPYYYGYRSYNRPWGYTNYGGWGGGYGGWSGRGYGGWGGWGWGGRGWGSGGRGWGWGGNYWG